MGNVTVSLNRDELIRLAGAMTSRIARTHTQLQTMQADNFYCEPAIDGLSELRDRDITLRDKLLHHHDISFK